MKDRQHGFHIWRGGFGDGYTHSDRMRSFQPSVWCHAYTLYPDINLGVVLSSSPSAASTRLCQAIGTL